MLRWCAVEKLAIRQAGQQKGDRSEERLAWNARKALEAQGTLKPSNDSRRGDDPEEDADKTYH